MSNDRNIPNNSDVPEHLRESVSALIDGELSASESAFLLKRMQHDSGLDAQWMRFQSIGDALRGQAIQDPAKDFSARVMAKISQLDQTSEHSKSSGHPGVITYPTTTKARGWQRLLGGVGLAAAVAWGALMLPNIDSAPAIGTLAQAPAPVTAASPVVGMHQVSGRIGSGFTGNFDPSNHVLLQQGMQRFMQQHFQQLSVQPVSQAAYLAPSLPTTASQSVELANGQALFVP
jgi:negative regulator of sigma E activity